MISRNYINEMCKIGSLTILMFGLLFLNSCKDEEKAFELSVSSLIVYQNSTEEIVVKGGGSFEVALTDPLVAEVTLNGDIIRIKGLRIGTSQLSVTKSTGEVRNCTIEVKENKDDSGLVGDDATRIEWGNEYYYSEQKEGFAFSVSKGINALGMVDSSETMTFDFSMLNDDTNWFRASASGNFTKAGDLENGLIVVQQKDKTLQSYIAKKTVLKAVKNGKKYLVFYLSNDVTVRVVTPVVE